MFSLFCRTLVAVKKKFCSLRFLAVAVEKLPETPLPRQMVGGFDRTCKEPVTARSSNSTADLLIRKL
jgi:hypothetical protein